MQQKHSAWVALGVICFSISVASYLNSLQARTKDFDVVTPDAKVISSLDSLEYAVYKQINNHRVKKGLPPLSLSSQLIEQARRDSRLLASNQITFTKEEVSKTNSALNNLPHNGVSTLIAWNQGYINPAQITVDAWLADKTSINSIEGQYKVTGVGIARNAAGKYSSDNLVMLAASGTTRYDTIQIPGDTKQYLLLNPASGGLAVRTM